MVQRSQQETPKAPRPAAWPVSAPFRQRWTWRLSWSCRNKTVRSPTNRSGDRDNKATCEPSGTLGQGWAAFPKYSQVLRRKQTLPMLLAVFRLIYPLPSLPHSWKGPLLILMETRGSCIHSLTAAGGDSRPPAYSALSVHGHTLSRQPPPCVPPFGGVPGEIGVILAQITCRNAEPQGESLRSNKSLLYLCYHFCQGFQE